MPDIDVTLKLKDELSAGMKKVDDAFSDVERSANDLIDQIIDGNPELEKFKDEITELTKGFLSGEKSMDEFQKE